MHTYMVPICLCVQDQYWGNKFAAPPTSVVSLWEWQGVWHGLCATVILTTGSTSYAHEVYACTVYSWSTGRKRRQQRQIWF